MIVDVDEKIKFLVIEGMFVCLLYLYGIVLYSII